MTGYPRVTEQGTPNGTPRINHPSPLSRTPGAPAVPRQPPVQTPAVAGVARAGATRAGAVNVPPQAAQQPRQAPAQAAAVNKDLIVTTVTPPFILSFSSLFEKSMFADKWAFRAQLNFDKRLVDLSRPAAGQRASVLDVIRNACVKAWGEDTNRWPRNFNDPVLDGDEKLTGEGEFSNPGYYFIRATTPNQPGIYDRNLQPIVDPDQIYPGCICRAEIYAAAYDRNGNQGVKLYFNKIQKIADGEPLVVRTRAEDVFLNNEDLDVAAYGGFVQNNDHYEDEMPFSN